MDKLRVLTTVQFLRDLLEVIKISFIFCRKLCCLSQASHVWKCLKLWLIYSTKYIYQGV